jgi:hypothetical protein
MVTDSMRRRWRRRALATLPYTGIVSAAIIVGVWASRVSPAWGTPDWVALLYVTLLTLAVTFFGLRQRRLQEALANLELREKVGVIEANSLRAGETTDTLWCFYVAPDARAALHLFDLADDAQRRDLLISIKRAYDSMLDTRVTERLTQKELVCVLNGSEALSAELWDRVDPRSVELKRALDAVNELLRRHGRSR